jgi:enamine deaminase RidA (YjgF/YER057c/UK114 family)
MESVMPSLRPITPPSIRPPFARYSHGVEVPPGARLLALSGQLGVGPDDVAPEGAEAQAALAFANIAAILAEAGMRPADIVEAPGLAAPRPFDQTGGAPRAPPARR